MSFRLIDSLATTDALAVVFSDESVVRAMLDFETALARVEARLGVIPHSAADAITEAAKAGDFDGAAIARAAGASGTVAIPLVNAFVERVRAVDPASAGFVHWGATSQDLTDSAMILTIRRAHTILGTDHARLTRAMRELSDRHARTVMLGRTLLQPAVPITFGLKVAGWVAAIERGWARIATAFDHAILLQFGGAAGTLAALGNTGLDVARSLATELGLPQPEAPWHTHRDRLASLVACYGIYTGTLGKIARDISLLMQGEVAEVAEPGGGSSAMPHKRNPAACATVLAAATRAPGLVASFLSGMIQEHERSIGGWHAEWPTLAALVQSTGAAVAASASAIEQLSVDADRMRVNIGRTNGLIFAERAVTLLASHVGSEQARRLISEAVERTRETGERFADALKQVPGVARALSAEQLQQIDASEEYLGMAEAFRLKLLSAAK